MEGSLRYMAEYSGGNVVYLEATTYEEAEQEAEDEICVDAWNGTDYCNEVEHLIRIVEY